MNALTKYIPIGEQRITLSTDDAVGLTPTQFASAATISSFGGFSLYTILDGVEPDGLFGRPIPDGEEVVLINQDWLNSFKVRRATSEETYVYVTYYRNG